MTLKSLYLSGSQYVEKEHVAYYIYKAALYYSNWHSILLHFLLSISCSLRLMCSAHDNLDDSSPSAFSPVYMYEVFVQEWLVLIKVWDLWLCMSLRGNVCCLCHATSCFEIPVWMTVPGSQLLRSLMSSWCSWPSVKSTPGSAQADERENLVRRFFPHVSTTWFDFKHLIWPFVSW